MENKMICKHCKNPCFAKFVSNSGNDHNAVSNCCGAGIDYALNKENKTKDGGPAFPCDGITTYKGVSVRDYFAAKAMQGISANPECNERTFEQISEMSYKQADAMLEAREK